MSFITRKPALNYLHRWSLVEAAEIAELRSTSLEAKLRQLSVLMIKAYFATIRCREAEIRKVRKRWHRIREALSD
jgi:hypothetical protein